MSEQINRFGDYRDILENDLKRAKSSFAELLKKVSGPPYVVERLEALVESVFKWCPTDQHAFRVFACCMKYSDYLQTRHWKKVKEEVFTRYGESCSFCCSKNQLEVHHRTYKNLGKEEWGDVVLLCHECHCVFHKFRKADGQYCQQADDTTTEKSVQSEVRKTKKRKLHDINPTTRPAGNF
jgi:hypothetical protein